MKNFGFLVLILLVLTSCADKVDITACLPHTEQAGFWKGVWHGAIMWPDFIMSLFNDDIAVYATNNNGTWYDFGYVGGLGLSLKFIGSIIKALNNPK